MPRIFELPASMVITARDAVEEPFAKDDSASAEAERRRPSRDAHQWHGESISSTSPCSSGNGDGCGRWALKAGVR